MSLGKRYSSRKISRPNARKAWVRIRREVITMIDNSPADEGERLLADKALESLQACLGHLYKDPPK